MTTRLTRGVVGLSAVWATAAAVVVPAPGHDVAAVAAPSTTPPAEPASPAGSRPGKVVTVAGGGDADDVPDGGDARAIAAGTKTRSGRRLRPVRTGAPSASHRRRRAGNSVLGGAFGVLPREPDGTFTTVAGGGGLGLERSEGGLATEAKLLHPSRVAADSAGNVYVVHETGPDGETVDVLRRVAPDGTISTACSGRRDASRLRHHVAR